MGRLFYLLAAVTALVFWAGTASAESLWERLVLPGDLTLPHAQLEKECSNCHNDFSKGAQVELCLDCHKEVRSDVDEQTGFHGRSRMVQAFECNHCHTDHEGRDFDIVLLDPDTFDHTATDFWLVGNHAKTDCEGCHVNGKKFREAKSECIDCHKKDDLHNGNLGNTCGDCHSSTGWAEITTFDHSTTDFPLKNAHEKLTCDQCHAGEIYADLPLTCVGCHRIQDVHDNRFGAKCGTCHSDTQWSEVRFDHNTDTDFALDGGHKTAACNDCHDRNAFDHPTSTKCASCHALDDPHSGDLGARCSDCHSTDSWIADVRFDHDLTNFPLIGQHGVQACEACHVDQSFQIARSGCTDCHVRDDTHNGRLGPDCATCHNPNGWAFWLFDHDRQTRFPLTGAHGKIKCESCHSQPVSTEITLPQSCIGCHRSDDVHRGSFGSNCTACHSTATFKGARLK